MPPERSDRRRRGQTGLDQRVDTRGLKTSPRDASRSRSIRGGRRPAPRPATRSDRACNRARGRRRAERSARRSNVRCRAGARAATFSSTDGGRTRDRPARTCTAARRRTGLRRGDGGRALLAGRTHHHLAHLGAGEVADLGGEVFERGGDERERGQQCGQPIARYDLGRGRLALEAESLADESLRPRGSRHRRPRPCRRACRRASPRAARASLSRPRLQLDRPPGELHPERDRLGVDAVSAAGHGRMTMLLGPPQHGRQSSVDAARRPAPPPARI